MEHNKSTTIFGVDVVSEIANRQIAYLCAIIESVCLLSAIPITFMSLSNFYTYLILSLSSILVVISLYAVYLSFRRSNPVLLIKSATFDNPISVLFLFISVPLSILGSFEILLLSIVYFKMIAEDIFRLGLPNKKYYLALSDDEVKSI